MQKKQLTIKKHVRKVAKLNGRKSSGKVSNNNNNNHSEKKYFKKTDKVEKDFHKNESSRPARKYVKKDSNEKDFSKNESSRPARKYVKKDSNEKDFHKNESSRPARKYVKKDSNEKDFSKNESSHPIRKYEKRTENNENRNSYDKDKRQFVKKYNSKEIISKKEDKTEILRLNKFISNSGVCSRRQADEIIKEGHIKVNGEVITDLGHKVKSTDTISYKGKILKGEKTVYIVMNKPKDYITSLSDPNERKTVMTLFYGKVHERIYPVGRLDRNTTGVLLFTNDGELTKKLTHPSSMVAKTYLVTVERPFTKNDMQMLAEGIELEDGPIAVDAIYYYTNKDKDKVVVEIHSGRNRIVRRIFEHLGYEIKTLDRIEFAGITKKDLLRGQWRFLEDKEIGFLKMKVGKMK
jgi:23S rRNA pseudouridine2605 synthase